MKITFLVIPFIKVYLIQLIHLYKVWGFLGFFIYHFVSFSYKICFRVAKCLANFIYHILYHHKYYKIRIGVFWGFLIYHLYPFFKNIKNS